VSKIAVIGVTGYAGGHITTEALSRGHQVIGVSRTAPNPAPAGVEVRTGSIDDPALMARVFADADVVIVAVHATVDGQQPFLVGVVPSLLALAAEHGTRLGFVGGAGSLQVSPGGPLVIDSPDFPAEAKPEASAHGNVLAQLRGSNPDVDWFYISPALGYGSWAAGERTGTYRVGDDVLLADADGKSEVSGADFALAMVDEIEQPTHKRARFTVAN